MPTRRTSHSDSEAVLGRYSEANLALRDAKQVFDRDLDCPLPGQETVGGQDSGARARIVEDAEQAQLREGEAQGGHP